MKRIIAMLVCIVTLAFALSACSFEREKETSSLSSTSTANTEKETSSSSPEDPTNTEKEIPENMRFDGAVTKDVLCNYLARAVTLSMENQFTLSKNATHVRSFILNTGAKYICRAATCWSPSNSDIATHDGQKAFIQSVHNEDPSVIFEACIFECISPAVNEIKIPVYVFEAFGLTPEDRCFQYTDMYFEDGSYLNQWGTDTAVPDITRIETQMFFYYRAVSYIDLGFEALHMGQVHLIGANDTGWACFTKVLSMIRAYAKENARRHFVFINAHTHGIIDADGKLMFDFHMYPSRPKAAEVTLTAPSAVDPQEAIFEIGHSDSIYGKSLGGLTQSGWECDSLPYLVELDNFGNDISKLFIGDPSDTLRVYGMDEISWFANQPSSYREDFLEYAYNWVRDEAPGDGYFAMPGQRVATIYDENKVAISWQYYAYSVGTYKEGFGDEEAIKNIWSK